MSNASAQEPDEHDEQEAEGSVKKELPFRQWKPLLFQACADFLVALLNIKRGHFPKALSTGDWEALLEV